MGGSQYLRTFHVILFNINKLKHVIQYITYLEVIRIRIIANKDAEFRSQLLVLCGQTHHIRLLACIQENTDQLRSLQPPHCNLSILILITMVSGCSISVGLLEFKIASVTAPKDVTLSVLLC